MLVLLALAWVPAPAASQAQGSQTPQAPAQQPPPGPPTIAPVKPQDKTQVFRSTVDIVSLNVTVVDNQNRYITDLGEKTSRSSKTARSRS